MSLGLSRDSIADLKNLAQNAETDDYTQAPSNFSRYYDDNHGADGDGDFYEDGYEESFLIEDSSEDGTEAVAVAQPQPTPTVAAAPPAAPIPLGSSVSSEETTEAVQASKRSISKSSKINGSQAKPAVDGKNNTYSGFDYDDYYSEKYSTPGYDVNNTKKKDNNILRCLFPFLKDPLASDDEYSTGDDGDVQSGGTTESSQIDVDMDAVHAHVAQNGSDTPKNGLASAFATPDVTSNETKPIAIDTKQTTDSLEFEKDQEDEDEDESDNLSSQSVKKLKGILKHPVVKAPAPTVPSRRQILGGDSSSFKRRTILPTYNTSFRADKSHDEMDDDSDRPTKKSVNFSAMARVMPVLARTEMSLYLKAMIWWQRSDYDDFKKTGRIIAKAMLQGGSEIWLQTSDAWGKKQHNQGNGTGSSKNSAVDTKYYAALKRYGVQEDEEKSTGSDDDDVGSKWWCKFGHSRRGLEHIVSINEGRQRQRLVNASVTAVLDEQRRQRVSRSDPKKISSISMQYTSWAKDLALAAGEADEEAVRSNFLSKSNRLSYLSSKLIKNGSAGKKAGQPCASFVLSANPALRAEVLDSHTHPMKRVKKGVSVKDGSSSETKIDISHQAAGFQYQQ